METVVIILMVTVCLSFMLKQAARKFRSVCTTAVVCGIFTGTMWQYAIEQSRTQIADWLADTGLMLDIAVVLSIEGIIQMAYCMLAAHMLTAGGIKKRTLRMYRALRWFPGILIFPVLFSLLVFTIFSLPGADFKLVAWSLGMIIAITIPVGSRAMRTLIPEKELRLELLFLLNAFTAILGVIATVNGRTSVEAEGDVDWSAFCGFAILLAIGIIAGMTARRLRIKRQSINKHKSILKL